MYFLTLISRVEMRVKRFSDFLKYFEAEADKQKLRSNIQFIEINNYIHSVINYLNRYWSFTSDELKGYSKILPIIFYLKALKLRLEPIDLTINGFLFYFNHCKDDDLTSSPWSDFQIKFVCKVLLTVFKEKSHIDVQV